MPMLLALLKATIGSPLPFQAGARGCLQGGAEGSLGSSVGTVGQQRSPCAI